MIEILCDIARKAGKEIMEIYNKDFSVDFKEDNSPLTEADRKANAVIISELKTHFPEIPVISEEITTIPFSERKEWKRFFLVDPLDGTKEFIKKNGEFTVNIAYVENGFVLKGVVYIPVADVCYFSNGEKSYKNTYDIKCQDEHVPSRVVASRSHFSDETKTYVESLEKKYELVSIGSSLKICLVAEGVADIYPRFGPTMEWDTAAAHAVIKGAGGNVFDLEGNELRYGKEDLHNPFFVAKKN